jgi:beta-lactamase regulating signal transducer with metallopeptidase domain
MTVWFLTWLWQGVALTLCVALVLKLTLRVMNAATRHAIWWCALGGLMWLGAVSSPYGGLTPVPVRGSDPNGMSFAPEPIFHAPDVAPLFVSVFLGVWIAIALVKLVRLVPGLHALYTLRDRCRPFPPQVESQLPLWRESRAHGRPAQLAICDSVPGATVLGFDRPCIALPSSLVDALTVDELDQIVLHEHAHVQRRDDWACLAQRLLEAALWIHPAVALIGRALNREREMACDEWVVARTSSPKLYARCLARAAEARGRVPAPALASALLGEHDLMRRVDRLLALKGCVRRRVSVLSAAAAACAIAAASVQLTAVPLVGNYVEALLPEVAAPVARTLAEPSPVEVSSIEPPVRIRTTAMVPTTRGREEAHVAAAVAAERQPHNPAIHAEQPRHETDSADPVALSGRTFQGSYASRAQIAPADAPNPWRATAVPGVAIASAAKKSAVGMANAFTRAGVSLAKSF